jgi:uncharacterized protein YbcC (UPF0753/DUF2309 family)
MELSTIRKKYEQKEYTSNIKVERKLPEGYIFDEELSVRKNREMVEQHNATVEANRKASYALQGQLDRKLHHDVATYITESYDIDYDTAVKVERFCYEQKHDCMYSYFEFIDTISDFVEEILRKE